MARIRTISPEQWTDDEFVQLSAFARLLTIAIRNDCDDNGIFEWSPLKIKMRLFPADNVDIAELLGEMQGRRLVLRYEASGKTYGIVRNFAKYQRPKKPTFWHPAPKKLPIGYCLHGHSTAPLVDIEEKPLPNQFPTGGELPPSVSVSGTVTVTVVPTVEPVPNQPTTKPSNTPRRADRGQSIPEDWQPSESDRAYARQHGLDPDKVAEAFVLYWRGESGPKARKRDWSAAFKNRVLQIVEFRQGKPGGLFNGHANGHTLPDPEKTKLYAANREARSIADTRRQLKQYGKVLSHKGENVTDEAKRRLETGAPFGSLIEDKIL